MPAGTLYVVATPIGNLEDVTLRALRILREAKVVAAEDTRTAQKLFARHDVKTPCVSLHEHSGPSKVKSLLARLEAGDDVAVISEAGTPGVSDPGRELVEAAVATGVNVVPIPGPAAFVAALSASGLPMDRVAFEGFLPSRPKDRAAVLATLAREPRTMAFYEAPHRLAECLDDMATAFGATRRACVAREVTKVHEEFDRAPLGELRKRWSNKEPKGELTVLVEGASESRPVTDADIRDAVRQALGRGLSVSAAAKEVAEALGAPRNKVYEFALQLR